MSSILELTKFITSEFNRSLKSFPLPKNPEYLYGPIKYSLKGNGKRFRPILVHLSGRKYKVNPDDIMKVSLAVELLHCFTLIHDDIMDSDATRRNMPTLHKQYDTSAAILAGDGIFTISQLILNGVENKPAQFLMSYNQAVLEICEGQALDKDYEGKEDITLDNYTSMVKKKTGALLAACCYLPAILAGETDDTISVLKNTGEHLGIAFQIQDDLFEIFGDETRMGKSLGSDIFSNKNTAVAIESRKCFKSEWNIIVEEFDGRNLDIIRNFLVENKIKYRIEEIAENHFSSAYDSLKKLGFDKHSELYKFIKIIQERHS
tara:strand:- start:3786 stop:4742 length:957 start_codon:yes stop_codon:yes gene_type:complete